MSLKNDDIENKKNEVIFFYEKMFVRIKDDWDSMTQPKSEN